MKPCQRKEIIYWHISGNTITITLRQQKECKVAMYLPAQS